MKKLLLMTTAFWVLLFLFWHVTPDGSDGYRGEREAHGRVTVIPLGVR